MLGLARGPGRDRGDDADRRVERRHRHPCIRALALDRGGYDRRKAADREPYLRPDRHARRRNTGAEHSPFERVCVRLLTGDRGFESAFLQRRVLCEPPWSLAEVFRGDVVAVASCVEEIDAALESSLDERAALRLVDAPGMIPPIGDAIAHAAEADPRHLQTRATKLYIFHCRSPGVSTHRRIGF
jgi:hypothetical protein